MPRCLVLSAWSFAPQALKSVVPEAYTPIFYDYIKDDSVEKTLAGLKKLEAIDAIIAWGLGANIACHAIAEGAVSPKNIYLISAPYQYVEKKIGASRLRFEAFRLAFEKKGLEAMSRLVKILGEADKSFAQSCKYITYTEENKKNLAYWLQWYGKFSCQDIDFSRFPKTVIIHGEFDMVLDIKQAQRLHKSIPGSILEELSECGHAPQEKDPLSVQAIIKNAVS